ncbi:MAG: hypothetical protein QW196_08350 [Sulfolobales archaeon]
MREMREEAIPLDNLFEELRPTTPKVAYNTNIDIDYRPKKMTIKDRERKWVVIVERAGKNLKISYMINKAPTKDLPDPEDFDYVSYEIKNPLDILGLDLPQDIKSAVGLALSNWEKELKKVEAAIAFRRVSYVPTTISDREALTYEIASTLVRDRGVTHVKLAIRGSYSDLGFRCYDGKRWSPCEDKLEEWIGEELHKLQIMKIRKTDVEDVKTKIGLLNTKVVESYRPLLSFDNCVLDVEKFIASGDLVRSTKAHSPDTYVFHYIPYRLDHDLVGEVRKGLEIYIPPDKPQDILKILKSLAPKVYEYLRSVTYFEGIDPQIHESRILFLIEMFGRGLLPGYSLFGSIIGVFKNIFMLVGLANTGKSTLLEKFYGDLVLTKENYATVNLGALGSGEPDTQQREVGRLSDKDPLVAMHLDLGKKVRIRDWSYIRQISGGDVVPARKLFKNAFDYSPSWKIYVSTNDPPPIHEEGPAKEALLSRFRVIEFRNVFKDTPIDVRNVFNERDIEVTLFASLYAIRLVYERGSYSFTGISDVEDLLNRYTYPGYRVVMEMVEAGRLKLDKNLRISSSDLYQECYAYINELKAGIPEDEVDEFERRYSLPDQATFTKELKKLLAKHSVKTVRDSNVTYFKGIGVPNAHSLYYG